MYSLPHHSVGFRFSSDLSLLTLKGIGLHYINSHDYSWNNRTRKDEHCLLQFCIDGEGSLEIDGITYSILPGDAFLIDIPGENHYYLPHHSSFWEFFYLEFTKECLPLLRKIYRSMGPVIHLSMDCALFQQITGIYQQALNNQIQTFFDNSKIAYRFWMDLTSYVLEISRSHVTKIDTAKTYIDQNYYNEELNLDLVADHAGLSKYYLCKEFHKKYGISPGKYIREVRISQACRLLMTNTDYTMQEIAQMVGYANNNYFGKVFRAEKGISPNKYKQQTNQYDVVRAVYETPHHIKKSD